MNATEAVLESWSRQCQILDNLTTLLTPELLQAKPDPGGWTVAFHLCHIHEVRRYWLANASGGPSGVATLYTQVGEEWHASADLDAIRSSLRESERAVREWVRQALAADMGPAGNYDHPAFFLQHMLWHEGYHFGLLMLALRLAGHEPSEAWEDEHVWNLWRKPD